MYANTERDNDIREKNRETILRYFNERDNRSSFFAEDATKEQPYFFPGQKEPVKMPAPSKPAAGEAPMEVPEFSKDVAFDGGHQIFGTDDPNYFFVENRAHCMQLRGNGEYHYYHNHYIHTFRFRDGKIVEYREFANPLNLMEAMGTHFDPMPTPEDTMRELQSLK